MLHAAPAYSDFVHARIISIDTSAAENLPGVVRRADGEGCAGRKPLRPDHPRLPHLRRRQDPLPWRRRRHRRRGNARDCDSRGAIGEGEAEPLPAVLDPGGGHEAGRGRSSTKITARTSSTRTSSGAEMSTKVSQGRFRHRGKIPDAVHRARLHGNRGGGLRAAFHRWRHRGLRQHAASVQHAAICGGVPGRAAFRRRNHRHADGRRFWRQGRHGGDRLRAHGAGGEAAGSPGEDGLSPRLVHARELQAPSVSRALQDGRDEGGPHHGGAMPDHRRRRRVLLGDAVGHVALDGAMLRALCRDERPLRHVRRLHEQRRRGRDARVWLAADEFRHRADGGDGGGRRSAFRASNFAAATWCARAA